MSTLPEPEKNAIFFYGHTPPKDGSVGPHVFSQWWHASFELNSTVFQTAEHYMMYSKALTFGDRSAANEVLKYYDPEPVKRLGRLIKNFDEDTWKRVRYQIVCRGTYEKFWQNPSLADYLVSTGDAPIFEASPPRRDMGHRALGRLRSIALPSRPGGGLDLWPQLAREGVDGGPRDAAVAMSEFDEDWKKWNPDREPGRFAHYCWDWDFLPIDEHCIEAESCHDMDYDEAAKKSIAAAVAEFEAQDPTRGS